MIVFFIFFKVSISMWKSEVVKLQRVHNCIDKTFRNFEIFKIFKSFINAIMDTLQFYHFRFSHTYRYFEKIEKNNIFFYHLYLSKKHWLLLKNMVLSLWFCFSNAIVEQKCYFFMIFFVFFSKISTFHNFFHKYKWSERWLFFSFFSKYQ